jgi:formylmethanofuran dehydrogenase subunit E
MYIPDNYDAFSSHQAELDNWLEKRPVCSICGEHIQDEECYLVNDEYICIECMVDCKIFIKD